ncbi:MAG: domain containing protein [Mycobacterium sp.]|nr:domain containing protein [Mycobacterium sp.]
MAKARSPWDDGRSAWDRLRRWLLDSPAATPATDGDAALTALSDVGLLRRLLDQAELAAVRTARAHGKSWAEIAVRLGVSRQSAWERWRDLDEARAVPSPPGASEPSSDLLDEAADGLLHEMTGTPHLVVVPGVVGLSWDEATRALAQAELVAAGPDPDGPPLPSEVSGDAAVVNQRPRGGARLPTGSAVTLWVERGGGEAGEREPRRPTPPPRALRAEADEPSDEAVG